MGYTVNFTVTVICIGAWTSTLERGLNVHMSTMFCGHYADSLYNITAFRSMIRYVILHPVPFKSY